MRRDCANKNNTWRAGLRPDAMRHKPVPHRTAEPSSMFRHLLGGNFKRLLGTPRAQKCACFLAHCGVISKRLHSGPPVRTSDFE